MVFFTCSHCGESVKKPSVAKHYLIKCKNNVPFLTCVDCLKDFKGNEYEAHTKCITELERYSAKGFVLKASFNKGERKQKAWSDCAHGLLSSGLLKPDERSFLEVIVKFDNIPRKKPKFMNFLKNAARQYISKTELVDRVWEKLENYFKECNSENTKKSENTEDSAVTNGKEKGEEVKEEVGEMEVEEETKKKKKKRKKDSVNEENATKEENGVEKKKDNKNANKVEDKEEPKSKKAKKCEESVEGKVDEKENKEEEQETEGNEISFNWRDTILNVISTKGDNKQILLKKLQKKVLNKYCKCFECEVNDKLTKKFMKKLKKMSEVSINTDYVSLNSP